MLKVTIVTLMYNKYDLTNNLLLGLYKHERENIGEVIVVDNGSTDIDAINGLADWKKEGLLNILIHRKAENTGFTLGANAGLKLATAHVQDDHVVFLISNDVLIGGKFIEQAMDILSGQKSLVGNRLVDYDSGWNKFGNRIYEYLDGSFLTATAAAWKELGFFDESYAPGDFEDVDLSTTAKATGYKLMPLNNPAIYHICAGTTGYSPKREVITRRNQEYFKWKWIGND